MSSEVDREILAVFQSHVDGAAEGVTYSTPLDTLGIHSLELTEIVMDIEEKFGIEIDLSTVDAWSSFKTVGDLATAVKKLLPEQV